MFLVSLDIMLPIPIILIGFSRTPGELVGDKVAMDTGNSATGLADAVKSKP